MDYHWLHHLKFLLSNWTLLGQMLNSAEGPVYVTLLDASHEGTLREVSTFHIPALTPVDQQVSIYCL